MKPWKTIKSEYLLRDKWLTVRADTCEIANGMVIEPYYVLEYSNWVHVVALDSKNRVLITRQYRHAAGTICTEIPCGVIESGESPITAARRELREETGCTIEQITTIGHVYANPATHTNMIHCFLAKGAAITLSPEQDESENISCEFLPVSNVLELIDSGEFSQGLHVASLMLALRHAGLIVERMG